METQRCKGCAVCAAACPAGVIVLGREVNDKGYRYIGVAAPDACTGCAGCAIVCPDGCITVYRERCDG